MRSASSATQLSLIDAFADATELASAVRGLDGQIQRAEAELADLISDHSRKLERLDFLSFQRDEIQKADPKPGEADGNRERLNVLSHAEKLLEAAAHGYESLYESESSVISTLAQVDRSLREACQYDARLAPLRAQAESA